MYQLNNYSTLNTKIIESAFMDAMLNNKMIGITGYPGAGKSRSIEILKSENEGGVFSIQLGKSVTAKQMYLKLLKQIDPAFIQANFSATRLMDILVEKLAQVSGKSLIIIDEAGFFSKDKVSYLLELYNLVWRRTGILILGPPYYEKNLRKWISRNLIGVEEFYSRISYFRNLERPNDDEVKKVLEFEGFDIEHKDEQLWLSIKEVPRELLSWRIIEHLIDKYLIESSQTNDE